MLCDRELWVQRLSLGPTTPALWRCMRPRPERAELPCSSAGPRSAGWHDSLQRLARSRPALGRRARAAQVHAWPAQPPSLVSKAVPRTLNPKTRTLPAQGRDSERRDRPQGQG